MPFSLMNLLISSLLKGGPLSVLIMLGRPWVAKILSNLEIVVVANVERTISTSGNRELESITTKSLVVILMLLDVVKSA